MNLEAVRAELPVLERFAYLNTGTFGPLPRRTLHTMAEWQRRSAEEPRASVSVFGDILATRDRLRAALAALVGADEGALALTTSTTEGCNAVVAGLRLQPGDEVVTTDAEHPGLRGAFRAWKLDVREARVSEVSADDALPAIERELTPRTRLIALSHVLWTSGHVVPVGELSGRGIPVLVDGAQAAGAIPVDVAALGCDFYTVSGQKWPLGPDATGGLYVSAGRVEELELSYPSYPSWEDPGALVPWPDARRFESVFLPSASVAGLLASLEFARELGGERFARARDAAGRCRELVGERAELVTEPGQATLVTWRAGREAAEQVVKRLETLGVIVRNFPGLDLVRASCGFWTSEDDLERLVAAL